MRRVSVRCPAKINLFLSVGPPDPSGYHPLRTVFQAVSLDDTLAVEEAAGEDEIDSDWEDLPPENTITKALRLAREFAPIPGLRVRLHKRIPAQSGLGGGSSDAAGVLRAAAVLFPGMLDERDRREIAAAVGADVPFFLVGGRARGEGYGERLQPLPDLPQRWLVVARPDVGVATPEAYRRLDATAREWRAFPADGAPPSNDFESVAPPECAHAASRLRTVGASATCLAGSGSAVFGWFDGEREARSAADSLASEGLWARAATTLTRAECLRIDGEA